MTEQKDALIQPPSLGKIAMATVVALIAAAIILVVAVLPAEFGIDPLGTGKTLGLSDLAKADAAPAPAAANSEASILPVLEPVPGGASAIVKGAFIPQKKRYKIDSREYMLEPGEGMEIKYNMKKGAGLVYAWSASGKIMSEFHGEPDRKPAGKEGTDYYESYDLDDKVGRDQDSGTFIAPSTGIHGWFWENKNTEVVTLKLVSSGFYDWIDENRHEKHTTFDPKDPQ